MMASRRAEQMGHVLQAELAELISRRAKDPRLEGLITVTGVKMSDDLKLARVYFCLMGEEQADPSRRREVQKGLTSSSGFLKRELGRRLRLRHPPELSFFYDESFDYAGRIERILKGLHEDEGGGGPEGG
jgi:ribosome-binding factor A